MKRCLKFNLFAILLLSILTISLTSCVENSISEGSINESSKPEDINEQPKNEIANPDKIINCNFTNIGKAIDNADNWSVQHPNGNPDDPRCLTSPLNGINSITPANKYVNYTNDYIDINLRANDYGKTPNGSGVRVELDGQHFNLKTKDNTDGASGFEFNYNFTINTPSLNNESTSIGCVGQVFNLFPHTSSAFLMFSVRNDIWDQTMTDINGNTVRRFPDATPNAGLYCFAHYYKEVEYIEDGILKYKTEKAKDFMDKFYLGEVHNNVEVNVNILFDNNALILTRDKSHQAKLQVDDVISNIIGTGLVCKTGIYYGAKARPDLVTDIRLKNVYFKQW